MRCASSRRRRASASSGRRRSRRSPARRCCAASSTPTRCAAPIPGEPLPERAPISHLALVERADALPDRARPARTRSPSSRAGTPTTCSPRPRWPPPARCSSPGDERPHVPAPGDPGQPRAAARARRDVIAPGEGELASHGEHGIGRLPEPAELLAACERAPGRPGCTGEHSWPGRAARAGHRRRHARADRQRALHRQPLLGPDGLRAGRQAARRGAEVTLVAANVALAPPAGVARDRGVRPRPSWPPPARREFAACDVLLMAAAVADFRPRRPGRPS